MTLRFPLTLAEANALAPAAFAAAFADIAEHSPWVATAAAAARPFADHAALVAAFAAAIAAAPREVGLALLRAHPDLAGRAARAGTLTDDSRREQAGAGLDTLDDAELARFTRLNDAYRAKFGFPFILAVKGATKHDILAAFEARIGNDADTEFATALAQVRRIVGFRLEDRVRP
jgi:OHCU decarboxylase